LTPANRTAEQLENHYRVEKEIATRLKQADREGRKRIYATMYDELFSQVPDHPRLTRRIDDGLSSKAVREKVALISEFLSPSATFLEFAPGDCRFAMELAKRVGMVIGVDISDQRNPNDVAPQNFRLVIYDGYSLDNIKDDSVDVIFSDQLIEHFHPEDTQEHFALALRLLKPGGKYIFRTPHLLTGPHDISMFFSEEPEGFHLKEWTYIELRKMLLQVGYSRFFPRWEGAGLNWPVPFTYYFCVEKLLNQFPKPSVRWVSKYLVPSIFGVAQK
jgi:SAM-dependent methyltransferase